MNTYAIVIIATLTIDFLLTLISDYLNLKSLRRTMPPELNDVYEEERYARSQEYTRVRTRFSLLATTVSLAAMLIFWFAGGFNILDLWLRSFEPGPIWTGILYIGILLLGRKLIGLPFRLYSTFVIEERFGFNKTTPTVFLTDLLKGMALSLALGVPLLAGLLSFFELAGSNAWLYCWAAFIVVTLLLQFVAPTWILPLFNKFTPLEDGVLRESLLNFAKSVRYSLSDIFVMDGSRRSSKSNAFFIGFGKHKRVVLYDTLVANHSAPELVAVLAHEIGHYKKRHVIQGMLLNFVQVGVMLYLLSIFISHEGLFQAFAMEHQSVYAGLIFFGWLYAPLAMILGIMLNIFSRKNEFEADRYAVETTGDGEAMVSALKKMSGHNLANLTPHPLLVWLAYSHPPVLERIRAIRRLATAR